MASSKIMAMVMAKVHIELLLQQEYLEPYKEDYRVIKGDYMGYVVYENNHLPVEYLDEIKIEQNERRFTEVPQYVEAKENYKDGKKGNDFLRSKGHFGGN